MIIGRHILVYNYDSKQIYQRSVLVSSMVEQSNSWYIQVKVLYLVSPSLESSGEKTILCCQWHVSSVVDLVTFKSRDPGLNPSRALENSKNASCDCQTTLVIL